MWRGCLIKYRNKPIYLIAFNMCLRDCLWPSSKGIHHAFVFFAGERARKIYLLCNQMNSKLKIFAFYVYAAFVSACTCTFIMCALLKAVRSLYLDVFLSIEQALQLFISLKWSKWIFEAKSSALMIERSIAMRIASLWLLMAGEVWLSFECWVLHLEPEKICTVKRRPYAYYIFLLNLSLLLWSLQYAY